MVTPTSHLVGPQRVNDDKPYSEFVDGVSCLHGDGNLSWNYCDKCGSRCQRDGNGVIIAYSRGVLDRGPQSV